LRKKHQSKKEGSACMQKNCSILNFCGLKFDLFLVQIQFEYIDDLKHLLLGRAKYRTEEKKRQNSGFSESLFVISPNLQTKFSKFLDSEFFKRNFVSIYF
jgi:hypothetical protein